MSNLILGIDIRSHVISAVLVKSARKANRIEAHAQIPISGHQEIEKGIVTCLETIRESVALTGAVCIVSYPADQFSIRNIQVPFKEKKKIRQILSYELEPTLPLPVEDLIIDFYETNGGQHADIVTAAIEKSKIESCLAAIESFKIDPKIFTIGSYAMAQCMIKLNDIPENCLFVDLDPVKCTLCMVVSGQIYFIRSFSTRSNLPSPSTVIFTEINRSINAFTELSSKSFKPVIIFLTGYGLENETIKDDLSQRMGVSVEIPDMVRTGGFSFGNSIRQQWDPGHMDNAFALTLIESEDITVLNFRKGPFAVKTHWTKYKSDFIKTGILVGLILVLLFLNTITETVSLQKKIDQLDAQIMTVFKSSFPDVDKIIDPLQQMRIKLKSAQKQLIYSDETETRIHHIDILNDISKLVPANMDVDITQLVTGSESVLISGDTDTYNSVNTIKNRLEQGKLFDKVTISSANIDKAENRVRFNLKIQLRSSLDASQ